MNTKFYTCTLLPEVTRDDPPKLGVRCNETGVRAAFWREEDRALFLAAPDLLEALEKADAWVAQYHALPGHEPASECMSRVIRAAIARATEKVA